MAIQDVKSPTGLNLTGTMDKPQMDRALNLNENVAIANMGVAGANGVIEWYKDYAKHDLAMGLIKLQTDAQSKDYLLKNKLMDLNETLIGSQERIAIKQLTTTKEIAEFQKDQNVAIAKAKVDGAVKIAKVNALNSQFYGTPVQSNLYS